MSHGGNNLVAQFVLNYNQCCTPWSGDRSTVSW